MQAEQFLNQMKRLGIDTLVGVPDSTLKSFCDYMNTDGKGEMKHYIPANEGAAVGIAIGAYLASGRPACVYMQNSGLGNTVNPITSLANEEIYGIPMLLLIGWRGEPGRKDEPQHQFMGKVTEDMLKILGISYDIIDERTTVPELEEILSVARLEMEKCHQYALVIRKGTFEKRQSEGYQNGNRLVRENAVIGILKSLKKNDVVVSTTGKISRELYEQADRIQGHHQQEFLTVGGMGHASMIAFGIAQERKDKMVYCIDGDGAVLMHMGSLAFLGKQAPENMIHICLNNEAHESVGGMPTGAVGCSYAEIAKACGYQRAVTVDRLEDLDHVLKEWRRFQKFTFVEVKVSLDSREDLGRPRETARENKENFMRYHRGSEE